MATVLAAGAPAMADTSTDPDGAVQVASDNGYTPYEEGESCESAVARAAAASGLSEQAYNYVCAPDGATVKAAPTTFDPAVVQQIEAKKESRTGGDALARATDCNPLSAYIRVIDNAVQSSYSWCLIYGQEHPTYSWWDGIRFSGQVYTGWNGHAVNVGVDGWSTNPGSVSWDVSLFRNIGILPPAEIDAHHDSLVLQGGYREEVIVRNNTGTPTGTYHVRIHRIHVEVPAYDFAIDSSSDYASHRFLCNWSDDDFDQCVWPDGEEAPI